MAQGFGKRLLKAQEKREATILRKSVLQHFQDLKDPRVERGQHHSLVSLVSIAILAILAGSDSFVAIERYGIAKQGWLETFLELPYGIASHDTFGQVMAMLSAEELETRFLAWVSRISEKLGVELIHIDGKTVRGSYDREGQMKALHSVSAWSSEHSLVLGQQKVDPKSNEITAVPLLLKVLKLKGSIVTLDAMGTQSAIATEIKQGEGDYVLALKGNQGTLHQVVQQWFEEAEGQGWSDIEYQFSQTLESGHQRSEHRQLWAVPITQLPPLPRQSQWLGLTTVVMVRSTRVLWNKTTTNTRFYLSSLAADAVRHGQVIRSHWSIENSLHWVLDVTFNEDASRIRQGYAAENMALLRRLSVTLLKREPSKMSLNMKRYTAALDNNFLLKILAASAPE